MKIVSLLLFVSSFAHASDAHLRCHVTSVFTQFFSEIRGDQPGFYSAGLSSETTVEYAQQIGSNDLACLNCAQAQWKTLANDHVENASVVPAFPKITLISSSRAIVSVRAAFVSNGQMHSQTSRIAAALKGLKARTEVVEKLTDASAPADSVQRVVNANEASLAIECSTTVAGSISRF